MSLLDLHQRPLRNLRLSVTDRCNLRCHYCMPDEDYPWLPKDDILRYGEISTLVDAFCSLGVQKIRITGGEPLIRRDLDHLIRDLKEKSSIQELALTTNGILLEDRASDLKKAGLNRITVSLDTLREDRFRTISRREGLDRAIAGIKSCSRAGFENTRLDTVVLRGTNEDELGDLLKFSRETGTEIRFIEYMDVGGATEWSADQVFSRDEILEQIREQFGKVTPLEARNEEEIAAPADRFQLQDGTVFGIIASTTAPFCGSCDRSRLTADGTWYLCLYASQGIDLKTPLRNGATEEQLVATIKNSWMRRDDRGAIDRVQLDERRVLREREELRDDPRLEMHTRGG